MKWKYTLDADSEASEAEAPESSPPQIFISQPPAVGYAGSGVRVVENNVYFYTDVDDQSALDLNQVLVDLDNKISTLSRVIGSEVKPHINLRINSTGGSIIAAMAIIDTIRRLNCDVHTHVEGVAASAATLISVVGKRRTIGKNSLMLIHQISGGVRGTYENIEDNIVNSRMFMTFVKNIYKQYTKVPMKQIDEILKHDLFFESSKCLTLGMVDAVI